MKNINLYVDGSWKKNTPQVAGWGYVIIDDNENIIYKKSGVVLCLSRQIDGELFATLQGLKYINKYLQNHFINIHYDYIGIEAWYTNKWKAKSEISIAYLSEIKKYNDILKNSKFIKINSHTGNKWNDYVDLLAKKAVDDYST